MFKNSLYHLSRLLKSLWLYFPAILFLLLALIAAWKIPQGKDLFLAQLENKTSLVYLLIALIFWSSITWYSSRLVTNEKSINNRIKSAYYYFFPRVLGFSCFTIIALALLQLPQVNIIRFKIAFLFFLGSIVYYFYFEKISEKKAFSNFLIKFFRYRFLIPLVIILILSPLFLINDEWTYKQKAILICILIFILQHFYAFLIKKRRLLLGNTTQFYRVFKLVPLVKGEKNIFILFNIISVIGIAIYLFGINNLQIARSITPWPIILLGFGVLLGFGNIITILSVKTKVNFHLLLFVFAFIIGYFKEPYQVKLNKTKGNTGLMYKDRLSSDSYLEKWFAQRQEVLADTLIKEYPVFLVIADGGASRAGYWGASVLAKLQDETKGEFSKHLLCLSGASGGSFGNGIYYNLLAQQELEKKEIKFLPVSQKFAAEDYLSYAVSHLLGPDYFRHIFPVSAFYDRSAALEYAMENPNYKDSLNVNFSTVFSNYCSTQQHPNLNLPILFINSTCMQNGNPGVISTVDLSNECFNKRIDILDLVDSLNASEENKNYTYEMKMSNAVVLGARFPYVSPAGKIANYYFVDGGYFDNSGAGVIYELLANIKKNNSTLNNFNKLNFYVLHVSNSPMAAGSVSHVHPLVNDLAAPIKTIVGAYGQQTEINDLRLKNYLISNFKNAKWLDFSLYNSSLKNEENYSMNWYISNYNLTRMNTRLNELKEVQIIKEILKSN